MKKFARFIWKVIRNLVLFLIILYLGILFYKNVYVRYFKYPIFNAHLTWSSQKVSSKTIYLKSFIVRFDEKIGSLRITDKNNKYLFESLPKSAFFHGAIGKENVNEARGSFFIKDDLINKCDVQSIEQIKQESDTKILITGKLFCRRNIESNYNFLISEKNSNELEFDGKVLNDKINRTFLTFRSHPNDFYTGFGEQFSYMNMNGRRLPIFVMEQGVGRGDEPITTGADLTAKSGGDWHTSYAGMPYFIKTGYNRPVSGFYLKNYEYSVFDFRDNDLAQVSLFSGHIHGSFLNGEHPKDIISIFTEYTGRMRKLPDWILKGAVIGIQGGTSKVQKIYELFKELKTPVAAFWLQDWVGQRKTSFGKQLWWNWELDKDRYSDWPNMVNSLKHENVYLLIYINPFLADVKEKENKKNNYYNIARDKGYLVKKQDGSDYLILNTSFSAALVDLSNPHAYQWLKGIIYKEMISTGAKGWMADFGEALPYDAKLSSGQSPQIYHNRYPEEWAKLNREVINSLPGSQDYVFFTRAGYTKSPGYSTLFWEGDQMVSWGRHDGIKSAVIGLLSGGLSGVSLNHSDIGGYTTITNPIANYHRSKELLIRWMELNSMSTVFRSHEGNRPEENHQVYSDKVTMKYFNRMARLYASWFDYRKILVKEASRTGIPVVRPAFLEFPDEKNSYFDGIPKYYMIGEDYLFAPILNEGQEGVTFKAPKGVWIHLWSQKEYSGNKKIAVDAPLGFPAIFYKKHSKYGKQFYEKCQEYGIIENNDVTINN